MAAIKPLFHPVALAGLLVVTACTTTEYISANSEPAIQAMEPVPTHLAMDVGIMPFEPGIPESEKELEDSQVVPDVRRAESQYIAYHLKDTMERTGNWGAVRVTPRSTDAVNLIVSGEILGSDGELLKVHVKARDTTGRIWLNKDYKDQASKFSYSDAQDDPFQDLYNDIANDLLLFREKLPDNELTRIRQVSDLKYARDLAPGVYGPYLRENGDSVSILQLPSDNDQMLSRINRIKEREYLFVDTLDDFYGNFYRDMQASYNEWRYATYEEALNLRQMEKKARNRLIGGAAMIAGGLYAGTESGTYAGQTAAAGSVLGGIGAIKGGLEMRKEAEIHAESLKELSQSLGSEITPYVLEIEGQTIELTGTADVQYQEWRRILKDIYAAETGITPDN